MKKRPAIPPRLDGGPQAILLVEDVERAVAFNRESLTLERKDGDSARYAELDTGDGRMLLLVKRDGSVAPMAGPAAAHATATLTFATPTEGYDLCRGWTRMIDRGRVRGGRFRWIIIRRGFAKECAAGKAARDYFGSNP